MAIKLIGSTPKAPEKFIPKKADTPKQTGGKSIMLTGSTPKAPSKYTPKKASYEVQSKNDYMRGKVRKNQTKQYAWESDVFKRWSGK